MNSPVAMGSGALQWRGGVMRCALGKHGLTPAADKREGDGKSPIGSWPIRRVHYRSDRLDPIETALPVRAIDPEDGWCDAPDNPKYNQLIKRPYPASNEALWREDHVYDIVVELGHNDSPPIAGMGSAIFFHLARTHYEPTEGCVAVALEDMRRLLADLAPGDHLEIAP